MGYIETLKAAGAQVLDSKFTGSYQGSWGAIVIYEGKKSLVQGSYGSCSGCDRFQAEFDRYDPCAPYQRDGKYYQDNDDYEEVEITKEVYDEHQEKIRQKMADFAQSYLKTPYYKEDIQRMLDKYSENDDDWFNQEEKELYDWAITYFD